MSLPTTLDNLSSYVARSARTFADLRARVPALAPHDTIDALLSALDLASPLVREQRDALLNALVAHAQRAPQSVAPSLLLVAFRPMLLRLRRRLKRPHDDDLDSRVVTAFLESVRLVRPGAYTAIALRWSTEKIVFAQSRAEHRMPPTAPFDDETHVGDLFGFEAERKAGVAEVARALEQDLAPDLLDALLATGAGEESLKAYVARTRPSASATERAAIYAQLCRARSAVRDEIRGRFPRAA